MQSEFLEHANITVKDIDASVRFLLTALPSWKVRGAGQMVWFGKQIRWLHVGSESSYIALQDGGEIAPEPTAHSLGIKHLGLVVTSVDQVVARLSTAGYRPDPGSTHPYRKRVYFIDDNGLQFEFIEYLSANAAERNAY